ncbi:MAG: hypothetical protein ABJH93_00235, partial [Roseibium sp.]|uniref:hypothetical protein n=1 Tax=Alphaproteobacteria TaxID=28211 RepID=UPI0032676602
MPTEQQFAVEALNNRLQRYRVAQIIKRHAAVPYPEFWHHEIRSNVGRPREVILLRTETLIRLSVL